MHDSKLDEDYGTELDPANWLPLFKMAIFNDQKIHAIKIWRFAAKIPLKEAKYFVESVMYDPKHHMPTGFEYENLPPDVERQIFNALHISIERRNHEYASMVCYDDQSITYENEIAQVKALYMAWSRASSELRRAFIKDIINRNLVRLD